MDLIQLITDQTPAIALAIIVLWFYNRLTLDFLRERKEMNESLRQERKEWLEAERQRGQQLLDAYRAGTESISNMRSAIEALRVTLSSGPNATRQGVKRGGE